MSLIPCFGTQVDERVVRLRQMLVHRRHHFLRRVRPGDRQHLRVRVAHERAAVLGAQASGDDDLAVFGQRLADRVERFRDGRVDEAAGVDDDQVGAVVGRRDRVALGAQLGQDLLGVDQRLRAAERDEADARAASAADRPAIAWHARLARGVHDGPRIGGLRCP